MECICAGQSQVAASFSDGKTIVLSYKRELFSVRCLDSSFHKHSKFLKLNFSDNDEYLFIYRKVFHDTEEYFIEKLLTVIETKNGETRSYVIERMEFESLTAMKEEFEDPINDFLQRVSTNVL